VVAGVEYLAGLDEDAQGSRRERLTQSMESAQDYVDGLFDYLVTALRSLPLVTLIGDPPVRIPVVSFVVTGVSAERVVQRLADNGVLAIGPATSRILELIGVDEIGGAVTLGLAHYSTMTEVDHLLRTLASLG
jgi:selenocysteine lyase/cysteine desulfurase